MKFALSQPPTTTPQPQEPVTVVNDDDRASKIYKTVEPAPPVAVDMVERQKKADEFLKKFDNLLINKSLKA